MINNKEDRDYVVSFLDKLMNRPNSRELFRNLWEIINLSKDEDITFGELIDESDDDIKEDAEVQNVPDKTLFEVTHSSIYYYQNNVYHENVTDDEYITNASFVIKIHEYYETLFDDILAYLEYKIGAFQNKKIWNNTTVKILFEYIPVHTTHEINFIGTSKITEKFKFLSSLFEFGKVFFVSGEGCGVCPKYDKVPFKPLKSVKTENTDIKDWRKYFKKDLPKTEEEPKHKEILTESITEDSVKKLAFINSVLTIAKKHGLDIDKNILENSIK